MERRYRPNRGHHCSANESIHPTEETLALLFVSLSSTLVQQSSNDNPPIISFNCTASKRKNNEENLSDAGLDDWHARSSPFFLFFFFFASAFLAYPLRIQRDLEHTRGSHPVTTKLLAIVGLGQTPSLFVDENRETGSWQRLQQCENWFRRKILLRSKLIFFRNDSSYVAGKNTPIRSFKRAITHTICIYNKDPYARG